MTRISLIGSYHKESGCTTAGRLLKILELLGPDVIFMEMHTDDYHDFFGYGEFFGIAQRSTLETITEIQYKLRHPAVKLIPVDQPTPGPEHFTNHQTLCERVEAVSPEYCRLIDEMISGRAEGGFSFLNSERYRKLSFDVDAAMGSAVKILDDRQLIQFYESWGSTDDAREIAMIRNINDYCERNVFERGAFIVGAAHTQPLIDKVSKDSSLNFQWDVFEG